MEFFELRDPIGINPARGHLVGMSSGKCWSLARGIWKPECAIRVVHSEGTRFSRIVWTSYIVPVLISVDVAEEFQRVGLTGWRVFDVEFTSKRGKRLENYVGLSITGKAGPIDWSKSRRLVKNGTTFLEGLYFDESSWDGSDLFIAGKGGSGMGSLALATARAAATIRQLRIHNIEVHSTTTSIRPVVATYAIRSIETGT